MPNFDASCIKLQRCMKHRQGSRWQQWNSKTLPQLPESAFAISIHRTVLIFGSIARGGKEAVRMTIFASNFWTRKTCRPITLQPSVAMARCRKTCLSEIVLLQYKAKLYLGFKNLRCHCKMLGCHFESQKRFKKTLAEGVHGQRKVGNPWSRDKKIASEVRINGMRDKSPDAITNTHS